MDEQSLISECLKGKRRSQKKLYETYAPVLLGICYRYCADKALANDVLQESFIKIFKNLSKFEQRGSFEGWLKRICVNTAISTLRKKKDFYSLDDFEMMHSYTPGNEEDIVQLITQLPTGYREIFNLHGIEGFSFKEISNMMDLTEVNVRVRYHRAKKKMQELLEKYFMETE